MSLSQQLLNSLVCPQCKGKLELSREQKLLCKRCQLVYPVRNGVPIMLIDEAVAVKAD
ncbi:MAG: hypothetical protein B6I36_06410 [Desulfobacteraceae bacterium 4572_35.1]|nr:MAG: hypothetical protein B6I36_06410 [Desulfobacteraceae bacterium 4572_35.1]